MRKLESILINYLFNQLFRWIPAFARMTDLWVFGVKITLCKGLTFCLISLISNSFALGWKSQRLLLSELCMPNEIFGTHLKWSVIFLNWEIRIYNCKTPDLPQQTPAYRPIFHFHFLKHNVSVAGWFVGVLLQSFGDFFGDFFFLFFADAASELYVYIRYFISPLKSIC